MSSKYPPLKGTSTSEITKAEKEVAVPSPPPREESSNSPAAIKQTADSCKKEQGDNATDPAQQNDGPLSASVASISRSWEVHTDFADINKKDGTLNASTLLRYSRELKSKEISADDLSKVKFGEEIKVLVIPESDLRVLCQFFGMTSTRDLCSATVPNIPMIAFLKMESIYRFMATNGYYFAGELNFDDHGRITPCQKHAWTIKGKEIVFTNFGFLYFEHPSGDKNKNVAFLNYYSRSEVIAGITCYSQSDQESKRILDDLEDFTKSNNCLRGAKIRDLNVLEASFDEISLIAKFHTWENLYYPTQIKKMFDLEIFGFLNNHKRYNARGIKKRGVLLHGEPGTGKTSLGYIICNEASDHTVIWITPELVSEHTNGHNSIRTLYRLADFVSPCIIILEDIDLFGSDREDAPESLRLGSLMNVLDGVNSVENAVTVAMTNRLPQIEKALSNRPGRFDKVVEIPSLSAILRKRMLDDRLNDCEIQELTVDWLVDHTGEWTGAQIQELINSINMYFIEHDLDEERKITQEIAEEVFDTMSEFTLDKKSYKTAAEPVGFAAEAAKKR